MTNIDQGIKLSICTVFNLYHSDHMFYLCTPFSVLSSHQKSLIITLQDTRSWIWKLSRFHFVAKFIQ